LQSVNGLKGSNSIDGLVWSLTQALLSKSEKIPKGEEDLQLGCKLAMQKVKEDGNVLFLKGRNAKV